MIFAEKRNSGKDRVGKEVHHLGQLWGSKQDLVSRDEPLDQRESTQWEISWAFTSILYPCWS